jgi:hypothetical protein
VRLASVVVVAFIGFLAPAVAAPIVVPPPAVRPTEVIDRYVEAYEEQQTKFREVSMEVEIEARLPRLQKTGTFQALRRVTQLGKITYDGMRFVGDNMIKRDVIARYLTAETTVTSKEENGSENGLEHSLAITPENYRFQYRGMADRDGRWAYVFQLTPKKRRVGLFRGELWIDAQSYLPVRESGQFVRNPSIFLRRMEFVRDYEILNGVSVPVRIESSVETRIVGRAEMSIQFSNVSFESDPFRALVCPAGW